MAIERILKELIKEKSFVRLLRDLEKEESIYKRRQRNVEESKIAGESVKLNQFYN